MIKSPYKEVMTSIEEQWTLYQEMTASRDSFDHHKRAMAFHTFQ